MKTIYCFGTSNTSGCGFEFTSKGKWNKIPSVYNDISDVNMNQKFFSCLVNYNFYLKISK